MRALVQRFSWQLLLTGIGVVAIIALATLWLLRTQGGATFALEQIAARVPGTLTVARTRGSLAQGLTLTDVAYEDAAGWQISIAAARIDFALWPLLEKELLVDILALDGVRIRQPPAGEKTRLNVPALSAPLHVSIGALSVTDVILSSGDSDTALDAIRGAIDWQGDTLTLGSLRVRAPAWQVDTDTRVRLSGATGVDGQLTWRLTGNEFHGQARISGDLNALSIDHDLAGPVAITSRGEIALLGHIAPVVELTHTCQSGCAGGGITTSDVVVTQTGALDDYAFGLRATVRSQSIPATKISAAGRGTLQQLVVTEIVASGAVGDVNARGTLQFAPRLAFDASGRVVNLDVHALHPGLTGRVTSTFEVRGAGIDTFQARLADARGNLNGYPLTAAAGVTRDGTRWTFDNIAGAVGDNRLTGSGRWSPQQIRLDVDIDARDLSQLAAGLSGNAVGQIAVRGTLAAPAIDADLRSDGVAVGDWKIDKMSVDAKIDEAGAVTGVASMSGLRNGDRDLGGGALQLAGTTALVNTELQWQLADNQLTVAVEAAPTRERVAARVLRGALEVDPVGVWTLEAPFDVTVKPAFLQVGPNTWRNAEANMSVNRIVVDGGALELAATLADMPLDPLNSLLVKSLRIGGRVDASVNVQRRNDRWRGSVDWQQRQTALQYAGGGANETLNLAVVSIQANLDDTDGAMSFDVEGDYDLRARGRFNVAQVGSEPVIEGNATLQMTQLEWLGRVVPGTNDVAGSLALALNASGALRAPTLGGHFDWNKGALSLTDLGIRLTDIELSGDGDTAGSVKIAGTAASGGGTVTLSGEVDQPLDRARRARLEIDGDRLKVVDWDGYEVWVSPDLALTMNQEGAQISGSIGVPRADVRVKELPKDAVAKSPDIRVEGRDDERALQLPVTGTIAVALGQDVHIQALGLDSDVRGKVKVTLQHGLEPHFDGRLYLENGEFKAYGQQLAVERGNLFFAGSIRNPTLDVQATRRISDSDGDVIAGVRVTGPADNYRVDIYSEPALPPTDALAYLILGRSSFQASGADGEALSQTALAVGMSRSSPLTSQLATGLGLDELSVAGDNLDDAELVAGKQLNDNLYVRFSYGVFSELGALLLRYRLSKRVSLEVGSADTQSVDLLYSIEK